MSSPAAPVEPRPAGPSNPGTSAPPGASEPPAGVRPVVSAAELAALLDLARGAVVAAVTGEPGPEPAGDQPPADAFVTLRRRGELRGCMGTLGAGVAADAAVAHAARLAAAGDPRFVPVGPAELAEIDIEVSVLGPARPLIDVGTFRPGRDGVIVEARGRRGLLLPQVAAEMGWGAAEMLAAACEKAGLRADAWRDGGASVEVFEALRLAGPLRAAPIDSVR